ncbi:MAG: hypothetical protein KF800_18935 [Lysobacter sp.]|nr:hypothetical protein [Lysobacter sp.]
MSSFLYAQIAQQRKTAAAAAPATTEPTIRSFAKAADDGNEDSTLARTGSVSGYVEATAALVPTEVLTLHALILGATTQTVPARMIDTATRAAITGAPEPDGAASGTITIISDAGTLEIAFWALALISMALYLVPRLYAAWTAAKTARTSWRAQMGAADWARAAIPPLAFTAWTMLQRATAFDATFPHLTESQRTVFGLLLAAVVIAAAAWLAYKPTPPAKA